MSYTIVIAGKGGTGKTTIASLLIRLLSQRKKWSIIAIDADPNSNLAETLGIKAQESISSILDDIFSHPENVSPGMSKERFIELKVHSAISEADGFDLLTMGRPEGPGCYCYVNNVLRGMMTRLIKEYDYIIIDNAAGLEHLSRRTSRQADTMLVISDATVVGLRAAQRINELSAELKLIMRNKLLLVNRCQGDIEAERLEDTGLKFIGFLPLDEEIAALSLSGSSLMKLKESSPALVALNNLGEELWQN
jgi:CO dehydrogenase maturation factor